MTSVDKLRVVREAKQQLATSANAMCRRGVDEAVEKIMQVVPAMQPVALLYATVHWGASPDPAKRNRVGNAVISRVSRKFDNAAAVWCAPSKLSLGQTF